MRAAGVPRDLEARGDYSTVAFVNDHVIPAALALLPAELGDVRAQVELLAIGLQESRFQHRRQIRGPARGFWQFEHGGGVRGVLEHAATKPIIAPVLELLRYEPEECFDALPHNDVLACVFARLLLWTHPKPLPSTAAGGWRYYVETWRPGKPHRETWDGFYEFAWRLKGGP